MSSSLARTRSLRKPSTTSTSSTESQSFVSKEAADARHGSPSRLPVKPPTRIGTSTSSATTTSATTTATTTRGSSLRQPRTVSGGRTRPAPSTQPTEPVKRATTTRYPPMTSTTRTATATTTTTTTTTTTRKSATRPTSSSGAQATKRVLPTHARAKSTTVTATNTANGLHSSTVPRLNSPAGGATGAGRTLHSQQASADKITLSKQQQAQAPRLRPAFNTLQQHYSPAKSSAPKPLTSTYLAPPSPSKLPANVAASVEASKLQTELLQLHFLHRDAAAVSSEWEANAKSKLRQRYENLVAADQDVAQQDRASVEGVNIMALRTWASSGGLEEKIQSLDSAINGLWTLTEAGGRYARLVRRFERWIDQVSELEEARRTGHFSVQGSGNGATQTYFISELDSSWKEDLSGITRRLDGWRRLLLDIGDVPTTDGVEGSSLLSIVDGSRTLIHDTLAELSLMEEIESQALAKEEMWIERTNRDDDEINDTPRAGAIWRLF